MRCISSEMYLKRNEFAITATLTLKGTMITKTYSGLIDGLKMRYLNLRKLTNGKEAKNRLSLLQCY